MTYNTLILRSASALENLNRFVEAAGETSGQKCLRRLSLVSRSARQVGEMLSGAFMRTDNDDPDNIELLRLANRANRLSMQCRQSMRGLM